MKGRVPLNDLSRQTRAIEEELSQAIAGVLACGAYVLGPETQAFERDFAAYCGVPHVLGVANGTDAIEIALRATGIEAGHRVATVANAGFYASAAIRAIGAEPAYVDVDGKSHTMAADDLRRELDHGGVRAVVVTHLYGRLAAIEEIVALCERPGVAVIEDCAQAAGAARHGRRAGSFGIAGCFSFYPTKNIGALGDGGAIVTKDVEFAARVRALRQYGWERKYHVSLAGGRNSRLDEIQAAVLRVKLRHLDGWNARRRSIAVRYSNEISNPRVACPQGFGTDHVAHLFVVRAEDRESLRRHLDLQGVGTDIHYPVPDHLQAVSRGTCCRALPVTEALAKDIATLPCFPEMTDEEVAFVVQAVNRW